MLTKYFDLRSCTHRDIVFHRTYNGTDLYTHKDPTPSYFSTLEFDCPSLSELDELVGRHQKAVAAGYNPIPLLLTKASIVACFGSKDAQ